MKMNGLQLRDAWMDIQIMCGDRNDFMNDMIKCMYVLMKMKW